MNKANWQTHQEEAIHQILAQKETLPPIKETSTENPLDNALLPAYLLDSSSPSYTYGELSYNKRTRQWSIKGDPVVCQMAKRLFPGSEGRGRGNVRFTAHKRIIGDLNWLMLRYPLSIRPSDRERWANALQEARLFALQREENRRLPQKLTPDPATFTGELMPFQEEGLAFLCYNSRTLLADEMGLGKTIQALAYLSRTKRFPALIIAPAHLCGNWKREISKFLHNEDGSPLRVHEIHGLTPYPLPDAQIVLCHYLLLRGWKKALPDYAFSCVLFDEIQELRRTGTEKYSAASLIAEKADTVIGLSGTPIYNRGAEIWSVMNILDYHALGDFESFTRAWCYGYGNNLVQKPELLGEHLRNEGLMLRRTKEEVLPQLPPKRRLVQEIDFDDALYQEMLMPALSLLPKLEENISAFTRSALEEQISQRERQATGLAKAPYVAAFVKALLEAEAHVLLFAHHHQVMDQYKRLLKSEKPVFITGRETSNQKQAALDTFMEGKTNLCVVSLRAAAGLNLQRADCVVFGEMDWSPAIHSQAEDRAHRLGQRDSVLCYYLVSPKGSDQSMMEALGLKVSQFVHLMGDRIETQEDVFLSESKAKEYIHSVIAHLQEEFLPHLENR